jgi:hypothetical protein
MQAYGLPEPAGEVKGLFVAVPQIERNRATLKQPPPPTDSDDRRNSSGRALGSDQD